MKFRERKNRRASVRVDLTPLIDVVFQLLIFFMLSATFVVQSSVHIKMPEARGAQALEVKDISITLEHDPANPLGLGRIYFNDQPVQDTAELANLLVEARRNRPGVMALIRCDARVETGALVEILGITGSVGIERYGLAAQSPEPRDAGTGGASP